MRLLTAVLFIAFVALPSVADDTGDQRTESAADQAVSLATFTPAVITKLGWGSGAGTIGLSRTPDTNYGAEALVVNEERGEVYILDAVNNRVVSISINDGSSRPISIENAAASLALLPDNRLAILARNVPIVQCVYLDGGVCGTLSLPDDFKALILRTDADGNVHALASDGSAVGVNEGTVLRGAAPTATKPNGDGGIVVGVNQTLLLVRVNAGENPTVPSTSGYRTIIHITPIEASVEAALYVGTDAGNHIFLVTDDVGDDGAVFRMLRKYDDAGSLQASVEIPTSDFAHPTDDVYVAPSGNVYQLLPSASGTSVLRWSAGIGGTVSVPVGKIRFGSPQCLVCNDAPIVHDRTSDAKAHLWGASTAVSQSDVLSKAQAFANKSFNVASTNISPTAGSSQSIDCSPFSKLVKTPIRQTGSQVGVPYKWGGFTGLSGNTECGVLFDAGLSQGKFAGDIDTTSDCGSCAAVGVDCSGFVSQAWSLTNATRLSTSQVRDGSDKVCALPVITDMLPGDIVSVNNGSIQHMRLFYRREVGGTFDGRFVFYESAVGSNTNSRVGIKAVPYTLSELQSDGYSAYRKRAIAGLFSNSDRVKALQSFNIRSCAGLSCSSTDQTSSGEGGTILQDASAEVDGYVWWRVDWDTHQSGWSVQCWLGKSTTAPPPPSNDDCSGAVVLQPGSNCSYTAGTVRNATASGLAKPSCDDFSAPNLFDVWYRFNATGSSHTVTVDPDTSIGDPVVSIYGACNGNVVACSNQVGQGGTDSVTATGLTAGGTYYVRIYDRGSIEPVGADADFRICVVGSVTQNYSLSVGGSGNGNGSVTGGGVNCSVNAGTAGGTCSQSYAAGTSVTLNATAASGSTFTSWSGDCGGSGSCNVTMNGSRAVTASFATSGDTTGPVTHSIATSPNPTNGVSTLTITATVSDSAQGGASINAAEFFVDSPGLAGTGIPLSAADGSFSSVTENVRGNHDISAWAYGSNRNLYVHGRDVAGNWGSFGSSTVMVTSPCFAPAVPEVTAPATAGYGATYLVSWTASSPDGYYEWQEATDSVFSPAAIMGGGRGYIDANWTFSHSPAAQTTYYFHVRAARVCGANQYWSDYSQIAATVVAGRPPTAPANLLAQATAPTQVTLTWSAGNYLQGYEIRRRDVAGHVGSTSLTAWTDTNVVPGTSYIYDVRSIGTDGVARSSYSNADIATTIVFTDDPLMSTATIVRAVHLSELRIAVNAARRAAGLADASFTDTVIQGTLIKALHIIELRSALDSARSVLGLPALSYSLLTPRVTVVSTGTVTEIRDGVR